MVGTLTKAAVCAALISIACIFASSRTAEHVAACGIHGPYDFDTYEAENYIPAYNKAINIAAIGQAVVGSWTLASGETIDVTYQGLESGPRDARTARSTDHRIPPVLFKSIAWIEATWQNAAPPPAGQGVPWGGVGSVIRSFDCGYGLGQITSGMSNSGVSGALTTGALKGASSIQATNAALFLPGDGIRIGSAAASQEINEITGKNGATLTLARPLGAAYPSGASVSTVGGRPSARQAIIGAHPAFNLAEGVRILADKWNTAPEVRPVAGTGDPAALEDWYYAIWSYNGFAFSNHPLNPNRNALRPNLYHCWDSSAQGYNQFAYGDFTYPERVYGCMTYPPSAFPAGSSTRVRLYDATPVTMPDLRSENPPQVLLNAFDPQNFLDCQAGGFSGGCASMDYPTTIPERETWTRADPTVVNPADAVGFLGAPVLSVTGPTAANLVVPLSGTPGSVQIVVQNTGTWLAPFRLRTSMPWLVARHPSDPVTRTLDGGVAVGKEVTVVITSAPRVTQAGYDSVIMVTIDPAKYPGGAQTAKLWIEPLYGAGSAFELTVTAIGVGSQGENRAVVPFAVKDH